MKSYIKKLKYKIKKYTKDKFVESSLCGVKLSTHQGTIRSKVDQDDSWFFYLAKHNETIYDIGCNIGYTALLALIQNPDRNYILVDPNTEALSIANRNLTTNNLGLRANYFPGFISDQDDQNIKFFTVGLGAAGSMNPEHATTASSMNSFNYVKTFTLDYLYSYYKINPDLVKIDVEGAELLAMDGAIKLARETQCMFFIEMHKIPGLTMEQSGDKIIEWCSKNGYSSWLLREEKLMESGELMKDLSKCHLLLTPINKTYPDYLKGIKANSPLPNIDR